MGLRRRRDSERQLTAQEAAAALGVSRATLYAYVSRGMVRSELLGGRTRERRYAKDDIARLVERKLFRNDPAMAAAKGLNWGSPVLDTALTSIDSGRVYYRGMDVDALARSTSLEEVAALLWMNNMGKAPDLFPARRPRISTHTRALWQGPASLGPVERCQLALAAAVADDDSAYDLRPEAVAKTGASILALVCSAVCRASLADPAHLALTTAWMPKRQEAAVAIRAALVLSADHELNVSAFTARCIASAEATPYEVVLGALAALRGRRHGGASEAVEGLFHEAETGRTSAHEILTARLRAYGALPGFGHPAYPDGDPRARLLITLARTHGSAAACEVASRLGRAARRLTGDFPNLDFGLVTLARALGLPREAPLALFAVGRTVGWIAHAIEQYADNRLIRPRARYVGPPPVIERA